MAMKYIKNADDEFVCPICSITMKRQNSMHYHMKKHYEDMKYECKICDKAFMQKQTLENHIHSKHPEQVECVQKAFVCPFPDCEFEASTKGNCIIHCIRIHYQDEIKEVLSVNEKKYDCSNCSKSFASMSSFYYHCKKCIDLTKDANKYAIIQTLL